MAVQRTSWGGVKCGMHLTPRIFHNEITLRRGIVLIFVDLPSTYAVVAVIVILMMRMTRQNDTGMKG